MQQVYKTNVTCEVGYSIMSPDGSWEKSRVALSSDVGPGYPEKEFLAWVIKSQIEDATQACNEQIENIAAKIIEQMRLGGSNGDT